MRLQHAVASADAIMMRKMRMMRRMRRRRGGRKWRKRKRMAYVKQEGSLRHYEWIRYTWRMRRKIRHKGAIGSKSVSCRSCKMLWRIRTNPPPNENMVYSTIPYECISLGSDTTGKAYSDEIRLQQLTGIL